MHLISRAKRSLCGAAPGAGAVSVAQVKRAWAFPPDVCVKCARAYIPPPHFGHPTSVGECMLCGANPGLLLARGSICVNARHCGVGQMQGGKPMRDMPGVNWATCAVCDRDVSAEVICKHCGGCRTCCARWDWLDDSVDNGDMAIFAAMLRNPALYAPGDCLDAGERLIAAFRRLLREGAA